MCGILGVLNVRAGLDALRTRALQLSKLQRHRGPDWTGIYTGKTAILAHERLAIVGVDSGAQPLLSPDRRLAVSVNGEIYNHQALERSLTQPYPLATGSDCEVLLPLYLEHGAEFVDRLEGMFAFVLYDDVNDDYLIARDHIGICPLYTGHDEHGNLWVSSELKAIEPVCRVVAEFPPGHVETKAGRRRYYTRPWMSYDNVAGNPADPATIRVALEQAVHSHLMSDVPYGVLLSGGLDSSLVAAIAKRFVKRRIEDADNSEAWWPQLHTFSIGLSESPDLKAARVASAYIGSVHHEYTYTVQEGLDALSDVIFHIESYDVTSVRASTPMYLMARKIRAMGIKMVLSGEGSDEIFGGYLYFHKAPNGRALHEETLRKLDRLHSYDCLRANKSMAAWGVEARVPFLDKHFLDVAMSIDPDAKLCRPPGGSGAARIEKHILREAFVGYLPDEILWRQKEQFSDGVGYSWIDSLKAHAERVVSDQQMATAQFRFPVNTPLTKEGYLYRQLFESHFKLPSAVDTIPGGKSVACSTPEALAWDSSLDLNDPSGRAVRAVHQNSY